MDSRIMLNTLLYFSITFLLTQYFQLKDCSTEYVNMIMTTLKPFNWKFYLFTENMFLEMFLRHNLHMIALLFNVQFKTCRIFTDLCDCLCNLILEYLNHPQNKSAYSQNLSIPLQSAFFLEIHLLGRFSVFCPLSGPLCGWSLFQMLLRLWRQESSVFFS